MLRINQLSLPVHHTDAELKNKICRHLGIKNEELITYTIAKQSIDARKKNDIRYSYTIDVSVKNENRIHSDKAKQYEPVIYRMPENGSVKLTHRPVIVGAGPAGLFAGLLMARAGLCPLIIERGEKAVKRKEKVERFWKGEALDINSNVAFGEGGAGTFSDGKLNTLVKDGNGRNFEVLRTFVQFGADASILYLQKPHIGTDKLITIITSMRNEIERLGGEVRFESILTDIIVKDENEGKSIKAIQINDNELIEAEAVVIATGHSARDTYELLKRKEVYMEQKAFAVGLRIQHPQHMIDISQFGDKEADYLSPASYKLTAKSMAGRGVYTFCMCPGGYVVDASTESGMKTVNGMSYHARASESANSAIIVQVNPDDYKGADVLAGIEYQRELEKLAYRYGKGSIPVQLLGDFMNKTCSREFGDVVPCFKGRTAFARLDEMLPDYISNSINDVIPELDNKIKGFGRYDAILAGVESRTSSPVRITRDDKYSSNIRGLYPCGEGAGYAGGITSAAMDGMRIAETIIRKYSVIEGHNE